MGEAERIEKPKENKTGIPAPIKAAAERRSGVSLDDVRVHYSSSEPGKFGALAYTEGNEIHIAPGQEKHIGHEVWHAVQQKLGRVRAKDYHGVKINFDENLEQEADMFDREWIGDSSIDSDEPVEKTLKRGESSIQCLIDRANFYRIVNYLLGIGNQSPHMMMNYRAAPTNDRYTTILSANLDHIALGSSWSLSGWHAEDYLLAYLMGIEDDIQNGRNPTQQTQQVHQHLASGNAQRVLSIVLSRTPCSSTFGTCAVHPGCLEELNDFANYYHYTIHIIANNWYRYVVLPNVINRITINVPHQGQLAVPAGFSPALNNSLGGALMQGKTIRQF